MFTSGHMRLGTAAPDSFSNGVGYDAGVLAVDSASAISYYSNGLPFTSAGRICVAVAGVTDRTATNIPFTSAGRVAVYDSQPTLGEAWPLTTDLIGTAGTAMAFTRASTQAYTDIYGENLTAAVNDPALTGAAILLQGAHDAEALTNLSVSTVGMPTNDCAYYFETAISSDSSSEVILDSQVDSNNFLRVFCLIGSANIRFYKKVAGVNYLVDAPYVRDGTPVSVLITQDSTTGMVITLSNGSTASNADTKSFTLGANMQLGNIQTLGNPTTAPLANFKYFTSSDITLEEAADDLEGHVYTSSGVPFSTQSQIVANVV